MNIQLTADFRTTQYLYCVPNLVLAECSFNLRAYRARSRMSFKPSIKQRLEAGGAAMLE